MWTVGEIANIVGGTLVELATDTKVRLPRISSRDVQPGDLFVALQGERTHGIEYAEDALKHGAVAVLTDRDRPGVPRILVDDSLSALIQWAKTYRESLMNVKVVSITGSVGKTTTKDLLVYVLQARFRVFGAPKSFNNQIGVPLSLLYIPREAEIVVLELGTNHPGEIEPLARMVRPHLGILTRVGRSHLEFFTSVEAVASEKAQMLRYLSSGPVWIHEANRRFDTLFRQVLSPEIKMVYYGTSEGADVRFLVLDERLREVVWQVNGQRLVTPQRGTGFLENATAVYALAVFLGISPMEVARRIEIFPGTPMRMEWLRVGPWEVLNDAYNANPESMKNLLEAVKEDGHTRIVFILGDMLELGSASNVAHREVGEKFVALGHKFLVTIGEESRAIADAAKANGLRNAWHFSTLEEAWAFLKEFLQPGDLIVLKASRLMALERILQKLETKEV